MNALKPSALPIIMVTASGQEEKVAAIEAGADDFIAKPIDQAELLARVKSLLRVKQYHDTIAAQAAELAEWNRSARGRVVAQQVEEVERLGRLRRFLSPQVAELILSSGDETLLQSHRREITVVFCDLRGFTAFSEVGEPEDVMNVLRGYHAAMGELIFEHGGTLKDIYGDGMMIFFNDPVPVPDATARAVRMAIAMQGRATELARDWTPPRIRAWRRHRHSSGLRDHGPDRLRRPLGLRRSRQRRQPSRSTVWRGRGRPGLDERPRPFPGGRAGAGRGSRAVDAEGLSPAHAGLRDHRPA